MMFRCQTFMPERTHTDPRDGLLCRIPADRCHDPVSLNAKTGPDTSGALLGHLERAALLLRGLPTTRKQNYELHLMHNDYVDAIKAALAGVCFAHDAAEASDD